MTTKHALKKTLVVLIIGLLMPFIAAAADGTTDKDDWRFSLSVYGWLPDAPVDIRIDGNTVASMPESLDNIISSIRMAAMFEVEAHKGPIGFFASPIYYKGEADEKFIGALGQKRKVTLKEIVGFVHVGNIPATVMAPHPESPAFREITQDIQSDNGGVEIDGFININTVVHQAGIEIDFYIVRQEECSGIRL